MNMHFGSDTAHLVVLLVVQLLDQSIPVPLLTPEMAHMMGLLIVQVLDKNIPVPLLTLHFTWDC
jgi:hypothetical protein